MSIERVDMYRNTNNTTTGTPTWKKYYPKTVDDAVYLTDDSGAEDPDGKTLKDKIAELEQAVSNVSESYGINVISVNANNGDNIYLADHDSATGQIDLENINEDNIISIYPKVTNVYYDSNPELAEGDANFMTNIFITYSIYNSSNSPSIYYNIWNENNEIININLQFMITYKS